LLTEDGPNTDSSIRRPRPQPRISSQDASRKITAEPSLILANLRLATSRQKITPTALNSLARLPKAPEARDPLWAFDVGARGHSSVTGASTGKSEIIDENA
jgi:hypothetical protein